MTIKYRCNLCNRSLPFAFQRKHDPVEPGFLCSACEGWEARWKQEQKQENMLNRTFALIGA